MFLKKRKLLLQISQFKQTKIIHNSHSHPILFTGHHADIEEHIKSLKNEFIGCPKLCFEVAKLIVFIRRKTNHRQKLKEFFFIVEKETEFLVKELNTRWLISICDTYADYGKKLDRPRALLVSTFLNFIKLIETERGITINTGLDRKELDNFESNFPKVLFSGMTCYHLFEGDMVINLLNRITKELGQTSIFHIIFRNCLNKIKQEDTILSRVSLHNYKLKILLDSF